MPNGYDYSKEYGSHKYPGDGSYTVDCEYGCGCSAGESNSHGPTGLDPIGGECPGNPKDGKQIGGKADYDIVVTRRIRRLEKDLYTTQQKVAKLEPLVGKSNEELADQRLAADRRAFKLKSIILNAAEEAEDI